MVAWDQECKHFQVEVHAYLYDHVNKLDSKKI